LIIDANHCIVDEFIYLDEFDVEVDRENLQSLIPSFIAIHPKEKMAETRDVPLSIKGDIETEPINQEDMNYETFAYKMSGIVEKQVHNVIIQRPPQHHHHHANADASTSEHQNNMPRTNRRNSASHHMGHKDMMNRVSSSEELEEDEVIHTYREITAKNAEQLKSLHSAMEFKEYLMKHDDPIPIWLEQVQLKKRKTSMMNQPVATNLNNSAMLNSTLNSARLSHTSRSNKS